MKLAYRKITPPCRLAFVSLALRRSTFMWNVELHTLNSSQGKDKCSRKMKKKKKKHHEGKVFSLKTSTQTELLFFFFTESLKRHPWLHWGAVHLLYTLYYGFDCLPPDQTRPADVSGWWPWTAALLLLSIFMRYTVSGGLCPGAGGVGGGPHRERGREREKKGEWVG